MKWNEMKTLVERCVPKELLDEYKFLIEIENGCANESETLIEIDNGKHEIFIHD